MAALAGAAALPAVAALDLVAAVAAVVPVAAVVLVAVAVVLAAWLDRLTVAPGGFSSFLFWWWCFEYEDKDSIRVDRGQK